MAKQYSLEEVLQLLHDLYQNPDNAAKEKASLLLGELQSSVFAWTISDQLLEVNKDMESCYFAAQTMRTKIQYAFHELPAESHNQLRDSLMNHAKKVTESTPPVIATQLCLALADLALQMAAWKNASAEMITHFGTESKNWHFLIELLIVMPEEINSRALKLGENRRKEITDELTQAAPLMLQLLNTIIESGVDDKLQAKAVRCLGSWFNVYAIPPQHIGQSQLLLLPFQVLTNSDCPSHLHEAACDCVCSALYYAADEIGRIIQDNEQLFSSDLPDVVTSNQQLMGKLMAGIDLSLAQNLCQGVMSLLEPYHISVATEDLDKSINYCRIFTEMAESFLEMIVYSPNQSLGSFNSLELLLTCVGHHQYEVADITFNFWYRLSDILYRENKEQLTEIFKPYVHRLVVALCRHCEFDTDHEGIPTRSDEFADFRVRVSELIKDVVFIVGSTPVFVQMFDSLKKQSGAAWETSEAALYVMTAVARNIVPDENTVVAEVLNAVLSIPQSSHIMVRYTSIQLVGELCEWIEKHPAVLEAVLQFLLSGLQTSQLSSVAAKSLQKICDQCRDQMAGHFSGLLQVLQAVDTFGVTNDAALELIKGTVQILSRMTNDKITEGMRQICAMQVAPLNALLQTEDLKPIPGIPQKDPAVWLDRLAAIFRTCQPKVENGAPHPCQPVIQEVWPSMSNTCNKYQADLRIVERCCRCIRYAIRCLGRSSATLLTPLVTQMVGLYSQHPHSCFLYLGSILVDEYGSEENCVQGLIQMLEAFCNPTFVMLEKQPLRNHPDTIDDLFRLCLRFVQRSPLAILQCSVMQNVLKLSIAAATLDHKDANASVTKFLTEFVKTGYEREDKPDFPAKKALVEGLLREFGQSLVTALINSCIFALPTFMMVDTAEVIFEMMQVDKAGVGQWLEHALKSLPTHSSGGAVTATPQQMQDFHNAVTSADNFKDVNRAIRDFSRLYR